MIREAIDWSLGWIIDDFGSKRINQRPVRWREIEYDLCDRATGEIIGNGLEVITTSPVNLGWEKRTTITTWRKNFRKRIGMSVIIEP